MSTLDELFGPKKVLWTKVLVRYPKEPVQQLDEYSVSYDPETMDGVIINHLQTFSVGFKKPFEEMVFINKEVVPDLIGALQKFVELVPQIINNTSPKRVVAQINFELPSVCDCKLDSVE